MTERPEGLDALLNYVAAHIDALGIGHYPMLVRWNNQHTLPTEVCDTCSDPATGTWVRAVVCDKARTKLQADPDCAYTYGVIVREGEPG